MDSAVVFLFMSVVIIGVVLLIIIALTRRPSGLLDKDKYQQQWLSIEQSVTDDPASMQFAIIQADKLLDKALKDRGFLGQTMAERMKSAQKSFTNTDQVWSSHKVRNKIAHEDTVKMDKRLFRKVLQGFKRALRDIGAL